MRARWVAKEFRTNARPDFYAPTPPLHGGHQAHHVRGGFIEIETCAAEVIDVRRAYFYAAARRRVFVELPAED